MMNGLPRLIRSTQKHLRHRETVIFLRGILDVGGGRLGLVHGGIWILKWKRGCKREKKFFIASVYGKG